MEGDGSLRAEKEKEEEAKWLQKKAKASEKPKAVPASTKPTAPVTDKKGHEGRQGKSGGPEEG